MTPVRSLVAVAALWLAVAPRCLAADVAADQRGVALGYARLETLALRIADAAEADEPDRAAQIREAIAASRRGALSERFDRVVGLLERERFRAAISDQAEVATQLEELLRLVMADPGASRLEEDRKRLEELRKRLRAAVREQRTLRQLAERDEPRDAATRQGELADRIERLVELAPTEPSAGGGENGAEGNDAEGQGGEGQGAEGQSGDGQGGAGGGKPSIAGDLREAGGAMRRAEKGLSENNPDASDDQRAAQRALEAAQRRAEERLRQIREEEQERRLAMLADRFRRLLESQRGIASDTRSRAASAPAVTRATRLAAAQLAARQSACADEAEKALRVVVADGSSLVFEDALAQVCSDMRRSESRLREAQLDELTLAFQQAAIAALEEMMAAVDESLDELAKQRASGGSSAQGAGSPPPLVSQIAELRLIRSVQARLRKETERWRDASEDAAARPVAEQRLRSLAEQQRRLAEAVERAADAAR